MNQRRRILGIAAAGPLLLSGGPSHAQTYPDRPIRIVVPFAAGGGLDALARAIGQGLSRRLGQPVLVDNKPGGNGLIATQYVAGAKPDGYTLYLCVTTPYSMLASLYKKPLPYDPQRDYTAISLLAEFQTVFFVNPRTGINSLKAYVDRAKAAPGKLTYASTGTAQILTLATEMLKARTGMDLLQVPFQGSAPAFQAVVAGDVDSALLDAGGAVPFIRAGRLMPLAVLGGRRLPALPDVPTFEEAGFPGLGIPLIWTGMVGPGGVPVDIVRKLNEEIGKELRTPEITAMFASQSLSLLGGTPEQMDAQIKADTAAWSTVIRRLGIQVD